MALIWSLKQKQLISWQSGDENPQRQLQTPHYAHSQHITCSTFTPDVTEWYNIEIQPLSMKMKAEGVLAFGMYIL